MGSKKNERKKGFSNGPLCTAVLVPVSVVPVP